MTGGTREGGHSTCFIAAMSSGESLYSENLRLSKEERGVTKRTGEEELG